MCCTPSFVLNKKGKGFSRSIGTNMLQSMSSLLLVLLGITTNFDTATGSIDVQQTKDTKTIPPTILPMKSNKPPILPSGASMVLQAGDEYFIESPDFKKMKYPNSARCEWKFQAEGCNLGINCPDFQLRDLLCFDHLDIFDNNGTLNRYCGKNGPKETTLPDNVTITFTSSAWFSDVGFRCRMVCNEKRHKLDGTAFPKYEANSTRCHCGVGNAKVVNGQDAQIAQFPWTAGLVRKGSSTPFCGGTLINSRYVLTAAHCVQRRTPYNLEVVFNATVFENNNIEEMEVRRVAESIMIHKQFTSRLDYDAALIRLNEHVDISGSSGSNILPVCLPTLKDIANMYVGENATVLGWGQTSEDGPVSPVLQQAQVKVISNNECNEYYPTITDRMLCAHTPGTDACQGDSGGPLLVIEGENRDSIITLENSDTYDKYVQIGIVSWGQGCGVKPGVYTRVTELLQWISINARDGSYCANV